MTDDEVRQAFDTATFWLLVRRFTTAPEGVARDEAKQKIFNYIANNVGERDLSHEKN